MRIDKQVREAVDRLELPFNAMGIDPYGISKADLRLWCMAVGAFYRWYFSVRTRGIEHVPARGRAMLVGNHSGGIAIDAAMVVAVVPARDESAAPRAGDGREVHQPRAVPGEWASRTGQLTGLPEHAERLLEDDRLLLVFPEGARGTAKLYRDRNSLVDFGSGFVRLALKTKTPIVPFAVLGGGEAFPTVANCVQARASCSALPYVPIVAYGLPVPLPAKIEIEYAPADALRGDRQRGRRGGPRLRRPGQGGDRRAMIDAGARRRRGEPPRLTDGWPVKILIPGAAGAIARKVALRLKAERARGHRHRSAALVERADRVPRGRHPKARRGGRVPQGRARRPWSTWRR